MTHPSPATSSLPARLSQTGVRTWMLILVVCLVYVGGVLAASGGDPLELVRLGPARGEALTRENVGYDGQFTYTIAVDPVQSPAWLDVPAYRLQRILLPVLARLLALGSAALIPWTILAINIAALVGGVYVLERLLDASGANRWWALVVGLFPGLLMPVRLSLNEPLAYGLVLAAIWAERRGRLWWGAALLALSALAKETTLPFVLAYVIWLAVERRWRDALLFGVIGGLPFVVWQIALWRWLDAFGIGSGGDLSTPFEAIPYMGLLRIYTETGSLAAFLTFAVVMIPFAVIPSLWGIAAAGQQVARRTSHLYTLLLLINALVIPFTPFSTFRELLGMLRFMPGVVIALLLFGAHFRRRRMLLYNSLFWLASLAAVFVSG